MKVIELNYKIGSYPIFNKLNTHFLPGITGIIGDNGSGKSTLLRILSGLCRPDSGKVFIDNQDVYACAAKIKTTLGYVPTASHLYPHLTLSENLYLSAKMRGLSDLARSRIKLILQQCYLLGFEKVLFGKCSDGIKKRAMIASVLLHQPKQLILDEPCAALCPSMRQELWQLLQHLAKQGTHILFSSHHPDEISPFCRQIYHLQQGRLDLKSNPNQITVAASQPMQPLTALPL